MLHSYSLAGGPVPLSRVKALVSMMTPRDARSLAPPPFVEFDMSIEGFACVLVPSMAPTAAQVCPSNDGPPTSGGVGAVERAFPPQNGLTYMCWVNVQQYSDTKADSHPVRLLTITRTVNANIVDASGKSVSSGASNTIQRRASTLTDWFSVASDLSMTSPRSPTPATNQTVNEIAALGGKTQTTIDLACCTIQISPKNKSLLISTHESDSPGADLEQVKVNNNSFCIIFRRIPVHQSSPYA